MQRRVSLSLCACGLLFLQLYGWQIVYDYISDCCLCISIDISKELLYRYNVHTCTCRTGTVHYILICMYLKNEYQLTCQSCFESFLAVYSTR